MKKFKVVLISIFASTLVFGGAAASYAQSSLPKVDVETMDGRIVSSSVFLKDSLPVVLSFWSTLCKPCITELDAFSDSYDDFRKEVDFKIVAVSTDDRRNASRVKTLANGRGWPFEIYVDVNQDLKRAMNVNLIPQLFILDKTGKIVYSHTSTY